jgi:hypothetical protein
VCATPLGTSAAPLLTPVHLRGFYPPYVNLTAITCCGREARYASSSPVASDQDLSQHGQLLMTGAAVRRMDLAIDANWEQAVQFK